MRFVIGEVVERHLGEREIARKSSQDNRADENSGAYGTPRHSG
jgi:hypothetical protein